MERHHVCAYDGRLASLAGAHPFDLVGAHLFDLSEPRLSDLVEGHFELASKYRQAVVYLDRHLVLCSCRSPHGLAIANDASLMLLLESDHIPQDSDL